ncbi:MAG: DUF1003 domain-containing protein, partial [Alphaproteobacteria bacterium]|nr:DUF1003 domain-containing protein [Alphaproteobacteria bacterium]
MSEQGTQQPVSSPGAPVQPPTSKAARRRTPCAICGKEARDARAFGLVRPAIAQAMLADHPELSADSTICGRHAAPYRSQYVTELLARERGELSDLEKQVLESLAREETVSENVEEEYEDERTFGERAADLVADFGGSWNFIIAFFLVLAIWMAFNVWAVTNAIFDPYPFILLNLVLSCLAAIQAPIIMMSQKRQEDKDRLRSENDYKVNLKAELEI